MDKIDDIKNDLKNVNELRDIKGNPIVQSVLLSSLKSIPVIGDMIDSTTEVLLNEFQEKKEQELIDIIFSDTNNITTEMVNNVEFIVNFNKTLEAVRRLATNDKVKFFGNLMKNGYLMDERIENSVFEEYFDILNTLSYREICFLIDYKKWLDKHDPFLKINNWKKFKEYYIHQCKFNITYQLMENIFCKLANMGFARLIYRKEELVACGRNKKKRKKRQKKIDKRPISKVYDIRLSVYFYRFCRYILDKTEQ